MARPRLLLVPSFTELEWTIRPMLEEWAEVASFDTPGVGSEVLPFEVELDEGRGRAMLMQWREAAATRALAEVDDLGWDDFFVVTDASGGPTAVRVATARRDSSAASRLAMLRCLARPRASAHQSGVRSGTCCVSWHAKATR